MAWSKHRGGGSKGEDHGPRRGYHHGNLRETLIKAALDLIGEKGVAGFTFADAARWAGVSPAAPYRHFRDRDALMADVARQGFERFEAFLTTAWNDGRPDLTTAFGNLGKAYLAFARTEPAYYSAMFESGVSLDDNPDLRQAGDRAFAILRKAAEALSATLPQGARPPAMMMALHIWSLAHGIASLFARGDAARRKLPMTPEELLEAATLIYLEGLGITGHRK
ncbi:MAG: TetR/AcrR family transcriptional regulator [Dongiaceae bacterium]